MVSTLTQSVVILARLRRKRTRLNFDNCIFSSSLPWDENHKQPAMCGLFVMRIMTKLAAAWAISSAPATSSASGAASAWATASAWAGEWSSPDFPASGAASVWATSSVSGDIIGTGDDIDTGRGFGAGRDIGMGDVLGIGHDISMGDDQHRVTLTIIGSHIDRKSRPMDGFFYCLKCCDKGVSSQVQAKQRSKSASIGRLGRSSARKFCW